MGFTTVHVERHERVAVLRFDRPPANAIELVAATELGETFLELERDDAVGALVITGARSCFSAGLDLKAVPTYGPEEQKQLIQAVNRMVAAFYGSRLPTVAAVNGHAIAGGLVLVLSCDYRIGLEGESKFGLTEVRAGIPFPAATMTVLRAELSPDVARRMTLVGRNTDPATVLSLGVLDELVPRERLLDRALEVANDLASIPGQAYATIKRQLRASALARLEEIVRQGKDPVLEGWLSPDTAAASASVLAKKG